MSETKKLTFKVKVRWEAILRQTLEDVTVEVDPEDLAGKTEQEIIDLYYTAIVQAADERLELSAWDEEITDSHYVVTPGVGGRTL